MRCTEVVGDHGRGMMGEARGAMEAQEGYCCSGGRAAVVEDGYVVDHLIGTVK
jgi:hypothetical protein